MSVPPPRQISATIVYFTDTLWPEFSIWHLLAAIFYYQTQYDRIGRARQTLEQQRIDAAAATSNESTTTCARTRAFLRLFEQRETERLRKLCEV